MLSASIINAALLLSLVSAAPQTSTPVAKPTLLDFKGLQTALANKFVTKENIPQLVRMSFHDLLNFDKATGSAGAQGCLFDQRVASFSENRGLNATSQALKAFVKLNFPTKSFSSGGMLHLTAHISSLLQA